MTRVKTYCCRSILISAFFIAAVQMFAWDERGPEVRGKTYKLIDASPSVESCCPVKENGLWGFVNNNGKIVIKPKYQEIGTPSEYQAITSNQEFTFDKSVIPVKLNGKWGFVGQNGKEIIKPKFDRVGSFYSVKSKNASGKTVYEPRCLAFEGNSAVLIDIKGNVKQNLGAGYSLVLDTELGCIAVQNGKAKFLTKPPHRYTVINSEDYISVSNGGNKLLVYTITGTPVTVDSFIRDSEGSVKGMVLKQPSGYKLVDKSYNVLSPKDYKEYKKQYDYILATQTNGVTDIYECTDNYNDPIRHLGATDKYIVLIKDGYIITAPTASSDIYGLSTLNGKEIIKPEYSDIKLSGNNIIVTKDGKRGLLTDTGECILPAEYSDITLSGNNIIVTKDGKQGLLTNTGESILPAEYESITGSGNNNYLIKNGKGVAVYNSAQRKEVVPFGKYTDIGKTFFSGAAVWVARGDKWGVATSDLSREIVPPVYDDEELSTGFSTTLNSNKKTFHIKKNGTVGVIGFNGKTIIPVGKYTGIKGYDYGAICVMKGNKVGLVDQTTGRQIVPAIHTKIEGCGNGHVLASDQTANGYIAYVYNEKTGALLKKQAFTNSQKYSIANFIIDWLGRNFATYNFEL